MLLLNLLNQKTRVMYRDIYDVCLRSMHQLGYQRATAVQVRLVSAFITSSVHGSLIQSVIGLAMNGIYNVKWKIDFGHF
jgi:hypothetical protein